MSVLRRLRELLVSSREVDGGLKALAQNIGVKYSTFYSIYTGSNENPTIETLQKICDYYGVSIGDILSEEKVSCHINKINSDELTFADSLVNPVVSVVNSFKIKELPKDSVLFFEKNASEIKVNNFYICKKNNGKYVLRKSVREDGEIIFISENRIRSDDCIPLYILKRVVV
jgi:DNA-binding Xre family transcriptional regulator